MKIFRTLLLLFLSSSFHSHIGAQCTNSVCLNPPQTGDFGALCSADACVLCDPCLLDGFQGMTLTTPNTCDIPEDFCGSIENNQWFAFLAPPSGEVTFEFEVFNCIGQSNGEGIQVEVYGKETGCGELYSVSNCWSDAAAGQGSVMATNMTPYCVYYLMIDGWANDICDFIITVPPTDCMPSDPIFDPVTIAGPNEVCTGQIAEYIFNHEAFGSCNQQVYDLEVDNVAPYGQLISETDTSFFIQWLGTGVTSFTVILESACFGVVSSISTDVTINSIPPTIIEAELCPGECYELAGSSFCDPGTFEVTLSSTNGCDSIIILNINTLTGSTETEIFDMPCNGSIETQGTVITEIDTYYFVYPNSQGCDSTIIVVVNPSSVWPDAGADILVACEGGFTLELEGQSIQPTTNVSYSWSTSNGNILSGQDTQNPVVDMIGNYCLTVTDLSTGCLATECMDVTAGAVPEFEFTNPTISCVGTPVELSATLTPSSSGATYLWTTVNGNIVSGENSLNPIVNEVGEYCLNVSYPSGCEAVECIELFSPLQLEINGPSIICPGNLTEHIISFSGTTSAFTLFLQVNSQPVTTVSFAPGITTYSWVNNITGPSTLTAWAGGVNGCVSNTEVFSVSIDEPAITFETSQTNCGEATIEAIYNGNGTEYMWSTGSEEAAISVTENGWYSVTVSDGGDCPAYDSMFLEMDFTGICAYIQGTVKEDIIDNCTLDLGDLPLNNWVIQASGTGGNYFATTAIDGSYYLPVTPGEYTVSVLPPSANWSVCQNYIIADVPNPNDFATVDFLTEANNDCPLMKVDIGSGVLRLCDNNNNSIHYCNLGTVAATNAYVDVTLDPLLNYQSATIIATPLGGNVYRFPIGTVEPGECGHFNIITQVDCAAPAGFTHCNEAHIYPDTSCVPTNPMWSGASLEIDGECDNEVVFTIENNGSGTMAEPLSVLIFRNTQIYQYEEFTILSPGETQEIQLPADGATWRIEVPQEKFHPETLLLTSTIQACGTGSGGSVSFGFVDNMISGDDPLFYDEHCRPNIASFDPNLKIGSPFGYDTERFIPKGTAIEYHIQFQNTGTDTAFNVVMRDTLSELFDIASLQVGASSHLYNVELLGSRVLKIDFPGINLPHKDIDEPNSIGYIDFKINVRDDLAPLTVVENQASIYFDFNAPVQTNVSFHTIEKPIFHSFQQVELCSGETWNGTAYFENANLVETINLPFYDSMAWTNIVVLPTVNTSFEVEICTGESYEFDGQMISQTGEYEATFSTFQGCDSLVSLTLNVSDLIESEFSESICLGDSYIFDGEEIFTSGEYSAMFTTAEGCDSLANLTLNVIPPVEVFDEVEICQGETFEWQGQVLDENGDYKVTLSSFVGCDSIVNLTLTVHPTFMENIETSICEGQTYLFNGMELNMAGTYSADFQSINGCDSTVNLTLGVTTEFETNINAGICEGETYPFNGEDLSMAGAYSAEFISFAGCDSTVNLNLSIWTHEEGTTNAEICEGEFFIFNGDELNETGVYQSDLQTTNGCDSTDLLYLTVWPNETTELVAEICYGEVFDFNGENLTETGIYQANLQTYHGCDSIVTLDLTVFRTEVSSINETICEGDIFIFNGDELTDAGEYTAELVTTLGCDSIVTLSLSVEMNFEENQEITINAGDEYNGIPIFSDTILIENLIAQNGCDSIVTTQIFVLTSTQENIADELGMTLFPNPTNGKFYIQFELPNSMNIQIEALDVLSRQATFISEKKYFIKGKNTIEINSNEWPSGMYLVKMMTENGVGILRAIVK